MSSIIFHTEEKQVMVATDSLGVSADGGPLNFTTKAHYIPHLRMILAGTGSGGFADRWYVQVNSRIVVRGIENLDAHALGQLAALWEVHKKEYSLPETATTTVYHFGFSECTGLITTFAYRSQNGFCSERLCYGIGVKPECPIPDGYDLPRVFKQLMDAQRAVQRSRPAGEPRIYIGGEIIVHHLTEPGCSVFILDRFDDYDADKRMMFERFTRK